MDYMYPSVFFAYFLFFLLTVLTLYFFLRSLRQGYWGSRSEEVKYQMMEDDEAHEPWRTLQRADSTLVSSFVLHSGAVRRDESRRGTLKRTPQQDGGSHE